MKGLLKIAHREHFDIGHRASLKKAIEVMYKNHNGCVILLNEAKPVAILTESDILKALQSSVDLGAPAYPHAAKPVVTAFEERPVESAFDLVIQHNIRRIVLIDHAGRYTGIVLQEDLFDYLEEDVYKVDLKIADILQPNPQIIGIGIDASLKEALALMNRHHIGSLIVFDPQKGDKAVGILTEKDILSASYQESSMLERVEAFISSPVISISEDALVTDAIHLMKERHIRRVLVLSAQKRPKTVLTNKDILKHIKGNLAKMLEIKVRHAKETMDLIPEAIVEIFDAQGHQTIHWMNRKARSLFGQSMLDTPPDNLIEPSNWQSIYKRLLLQKRIENQLVTIQKRSFEISGTFSKNINSRYIKLIFKDITEHESEKKRLKQEITSEINKRIENEYLLMQQSKLATTGEMIGHIAHQWRQPLAQLGGILMNLESAYAFNELTPEYFQEKVQNANNLIKYMSQTIEDFREFFAPNRTKEVFDLALYIQHAINIIGASLTYHRIELTFDKPKSPLYAVGYPSEFAQAILNLLDNAKDILVEREIASAKISIRLKAAHLRALIEIEDNGGGIRTTPIERIFDLYFSDKKRENASGLGLYMAKLIIESKMQGTLTAKNSAKGALFQVEMPSYLDKKG